MEKTIILQVKTTEKNGIKYKSCYIIVDLDYTKKTLTWNRQDIAELLGCAVSELLQKPDGNYKIGVLSYVDSEK